MKHKTLVVLLLLGTAGWCCWTVHLNYQYDSSFVEARSSHTATTTKVVDATTTTATTSQISANNNNTTHAATATTPAKRHHHHQEERNNNNTKAPRKHTTVGTPSTNRTISTTDNHTTTRVYNHTTTTVYNHTTTTVYNHTTTTTEYNHTNNQHSLWWNDAIPPVVQEQRLPPWMRDYLQWHAQAHAALLVQDAAPEDHPTNNNNNNHADTDNYQFLIVRCFATDVKCGGTADRLYPLPLYVLLAARLQRLLYIYWERPCDLSHYLEPPPRTITHNNTTSSKEPWQFDWRLPDWLLRERQEALQQSQHRPAANWQVRIGHDYEMRQLLEDPTQSWYQPPPTKRRAKPLPATLPRIVTTSFQSQNHGADLYNYYEPLLFGRNNSLSTSNNHNHSTFQQVYAPLWKAFFRPVPAIRQKIQQAWTTLQLEPDHYVAAHIRARYQQAAGPKKTAFVARNAMHCASQLLLQPQVENNHPEPIFVASDFANSTRAAAAYVAEHHADQRVVYRPLWDDNKHVLHLDRGTAFLERDASQWTSHHQNGTCHDYDDTFVDLYLLAGARCRTVHLGSFAKWAQLIKGIGDDGPCMNSHFEKQCRWKSIKKH